MWLSVRDITGCGLAGGALLAQDEGLALFLLARSAGFQVVLTHLFSLGGAHTISVGCAVKLWKGSCFPLSIPEAVRYFSFYALGPLSAQFPEKGAESWS